MKTTAANSARSLKAGDTVEWNSPGGKAVGKVLKSVTAAAKVKGHVARASVAEPQYLVRSETSGGKAIHKPAVLKKRGK